jgi:hypothetical protein
MDIRLAKKLFRSIVPFLVCLGFFTSYQNQPVLARQASHSETTYTLHLPAVMSNRVTPFGVEEGISYLTKPEFLTRTQELGVSWVRLNSRISWRALQPVEGGPIHWSRLENFEDELRAIREAHLTPIVIIDDNPLWAVVNSRQDGRLTSCAAIKTEYFDDFASFVRQVVARYSTSEFNVHNWEIGNEPDVDPDLVDVNMGFGCWGNIDDPNYGGAHYGEMLKVVSPQIRAADPAAKIWLGGLLLATPLTTDPASGHPENFLKGVLESGAGPHFDIVPYHWYASYGTIEADYDRERSGSWKDWGGGTVGKARYLRNILNSYNLDKPVFLNETAMGCPDNIRPYPWCYTPDDLFYEVQADHIVRSVVRGLSEQISGIIWYTLDYPGWRHTSLVNSEGNPKLVYLAYQHLINKVASASYIGTTNYGSGTEGYAFRRQTDTVQVIWLNTVTSAVIMIPKDAFIEATDQYGHVLNPTPTDTGYLLMIRINPVFIRVRH